MPNTWKPEPYEPSSDGVIEHNLIYWNNFDYFRPGSPVKTTAHGINGTDLNFPIGAGVMLFGVSRWTVKDNSIFGNLLWGAAAFSGPTNDTGKAINDDNTIVDTSPTDSNLYPTCPNTVGTGTINGDSSQVLQLLAVAGSQPPDTMERFWHVHPHPARKGRKPYEG